MGQQAENQALPGQQATSEGKENCAGTNGRPPDRGMPLQHVTRQILVGRHVAETGVNVSGID